MKTYKMIDGAVIQKDSNHKGFWNVMETKAGNLTGKILFTGSIKDITNIIKSVRL